MEPFSVGAVFACINSAFKFAEYAVRVAEVGTENEVFVRTIQVVRNDLNETERLLGVKSVQAKLVSTPYKFQWIKGAVHSTKLALNEIGRWVERARGEQYATGSVRFETRVRWVFNDHEKLINRQAELSMCHQQLSNVLNYLIPLEEVSSNIEPPNYHDTMSFDDILSPRQRRTSTHTTSSASMSSVDAKARESILSTTQEYLPGEPGPVPLSSILMTSTAPAPTATCYDAHSAWNADISSPPSSPPPMYTPTIKPICKAEATMDERVSDGIRKPDILKSKAYSGSSYGLNNIPSEKATESWAYECDAIENTIPELQGDTVSLSATNCLGPVNPFELSGGLMASNFRLDASKASSNDENVSHLAEMMGDMLLPVELPANDPGPPPGYPRRIMPRAPPEPHADIVRHRPVPMRSRSPPFGATQELPAPPHAKAPGSLSSQRAPTPVEVGIEEIQLHGAQMRFATSVQSSPVRTPLSTGVCSMYPSIVNNSSIYGPFTSTIFGVHTPVVVQNSSKMPPKVLETATSTRMQSQRAFMDMLGSIDQT